MSRTAVVFGLALAVSSVVAARAEAQGPGAGPPMPMAVDLSKASVGSWADYTMTVASMPQMKMRMALVSKTEKGTPTYAVETQVEGGMMPSGAGKVMMQSTLAGAGSDVKLQKVVMQMGANDPMEMPLDPSMARQFQKPDPKTLIKEETVKVPAGSFKTKHYRQKTPQGDVFDFWVSETVPPYGVVKMEGEQKSNPAVKGKLKMELVGTGKDAKPSITKTPKPFDQAALMQQVMGGKGAPGQAPAAPAPAAPAAAPAKK
jgi:hypothetical protein